jgi:FkbM family methyltransferase
MLNKILELVSIKGALLTRINTKKFSLASYKMIRRMIKTGVSAKTIIDIGANKGQFSNLAYHMFNPDKIIAIEANPDLAKDLNKNLSHIENKTILMTGIGNKDGELSFNFNTDSQVSSFLKNDQDRLNYFPNDRTFKKSNLPIAKLDSLINQSNLDGPILIKIDVQGFEKDVINGAINNLKRVKWLLLEISFSSLYVGQPNFQEIVNILNNLGFTFVGPMDFHENPERSSIIEMDALFLKDSV